MRLLITSLPLIVFLVALAVAARLIRPGTRIWPHHRLAFLVGVAVVAVAGTVTTVLSGHATPVTTIAITLLWLVLLYEGYRQYRLHRSS